MATTGPWTYDQIINTPWFEANKKKYKAPSEDTWVTLDWHLPLITAGDGINKIGSCDTCINDAINKGPPLVSNYTDNVYKDFNLLNTTKLDYKTNAKNNYRAHNLNAKKYDEWFTYGVWNPNDPNAASNTTALCQREFGPEFIPTDDNRGIINLKDYNKYGSSDSNYAPVRCKWQGPLGSPYECCIYGNKNYLDKGLNVNCHPDFISSDPNKFSSACDQYIMTDPNRYCNNSDNVNDVRCWNWCNSGKNSQYCPILMTALCRDVTSALAPDSDRDPDPDKLDAAMKWAISYQGITKVRLSDIDNMIMAYGNMLLDKYASSGNIYDILNDKYYPQCSCYLASKMPSGFSELKGTCEGNDECLLDSTTGEPISAPQIIPECYDPTCVASGYRFNPGDNCNLQLCYNTNVNLEGTTIANIQSCDQTQTSDGETPEEQSRRKLMALFILIIGFIIIVGLLALFITTRKKDEKLTKLTELTEVMVAEQQQQQQ
jgi:hypothetical protein